MGLEKMQSKAEKKRGGGKYIASYLSSLFYELGQ